MISTYVYIKFGEYHGRKAKVINETVKNGELAFILEVDGKHIIKRQKNTVRVIK